MYPVCRRAPPLRRPARSRAARGGESAPHGASGGDAAAGGPAAGGGSVGSGRVEPAAPPLAGGGGQPAIGHGGRRRSVARRAGTQPRGRRREPYGRRTERL